MAAILSRPQCVKYPISSSWRVSYRELCWWRQYVYYARPPSEYAVHFSYVECRRLCAKWCWLWITSWMRINRGMFQHPTTELILGLRQANERRRYTVTPSLIGWGANLELAVDKTFYLKILWSLGTIFTFEIIGLLWNLAENWHREACEIQRHWTILNTNFAAPKLDEFLR